MPARMKDVARDLNVSVVTVSKALRDQSDISPATKKRILKRARELKYQPNWIARSIAGLKANYVGVNDETVGQIATEHLIVCGCRAIAHIGGPKIGTAIGR